MVEDTITNLSCIYNLYFCGPFVLDAPLSSSITSQTTESRVCEVEPFIKSIQYLLKQTSLGPYSLIYPWHRTIASNLTLARLTSSTIRSPHQMLCEPLQRFAHRRRLPKLEGHMLPIQSALGPLYGLDLSIISSRRLSEKVGPEAMRPDYPQVQTGF